MLPYREKFDNFIKNNPKKIIIAWAEREIAEYKKLIKILNEK